MGHGAIVHGAEVGEGSLIGMHATLLNGCKVGSHCIVGAGALVPEGKEIPGRHGGRRGARPRGEGHRKRAGRLLRI